MELAGEDRQDYKDQPDRRANQTDLEQARAVCGTRQIKLKLKRYYGRLHSYLATSVLTVSASIRFSFTSYPIPTPAGRVMVPRGVTSTGGVMMSSAQ